VYCDDGALLLLCTMGRIIGKSAVLSNRAQPYNTPYSTDQPPWQEFCLATGFHFGEAISAMSMSISSVLSSGLVGIQAGAAMTNRAGGQIAQINTFRESEQLAASMLDLRVGELQVKFAADVVKVADELLGTIIDVKA
jgi:hypothetical protein